MSEKKTKTLSPEEQQKQEAAAFLESVETKAKSLFEAYGKVTPIIITDDDGAKVVGYLQKPLYDTIMYCNDQLLNKQTTMAAEQLLKDCLIKEESDLRILSSSRADAGIRAAFVMSALKMIRPYTDEYKKK